MRPIAVVTSAKTTGHYTIFHVHSKAAPSQEEVVGELGREGRGRCRIASLSAVRFSSSCQPSVDSKYISTPAQGANKRPKLARPFQIAGATGAVVRSRVAATCGRADQTLADLTLAVIG